MKKSKLQGLADWETIKSPVPYLTGYCPKCKNYIDDLGMIGGFLAKCRNCKRFWGVKLVDVTKQLSKDFIKHHSS